MLKWYLHIYIFIEYLKCVWKSNRIWIIRNDSKKKKRVRTASPGSGSASGFGRVWRRGPSQNKRSKGTFQTNNITYDSNPSIVLFKANRIPKGSADPKNKNKGI